MIEIHGKCLCGQVEFKLSCTLPGIYQCHCSLCRKTTGAAANAAMIVSSESFQWIHGQENIASYVHATGYRADFCTTCGSPVPNPLGSRPEYWVPAGLLEDGVATDVAAHLHVGSKASWDVVPVGGVQYIEAPDLDRLLEVLRHTVTARHAD